MVNRVYFNEAAEIKLTLGVILGATSVFSAGRNSYCIDKNYGGALIIWDRMFGEHHQINFPTFYFLFDGHVDTVRDQLGRSSEVLQPVWGIPPRNHDVVGRTAVLVSQETDLQSRVKIA